MRYTETLLVSEIPYILWLESAPPEARRYENYERISDYTRKLQSLSTFLR